MTISTKTTIKAFYETGDFPSQSNFADFIDSTLFLAETTSQTIQHNLVISGSLIVSGGASYPGGITVSGNALGTAAFLNTTAIITNNTSGGLGLGTTTVSAGTYTAPTITVDNTGRLTNATSNTLSTTNFKTGSFTYDVSTASGTQTISGLGFTPKQVDFIAYFSSGGNTASISWGYDDKVSPVSVTNQTGTFAPQSPGAVSIVLTVSGGNQVTAVLTAFANGSFTLTWTKQGSPTGTATILYSAKG